MRKRTYLLSLLFLFAILIFMQGCEQKKASNINELDGEITVSGSFALYPLAMKWAEEFQKINSKVIIDVTAGGTGKGVSDALSNSVELGMVGREINEEEIKNGAWYVSVTKDAVLASGNVNNPVLKQIFEKGISAQIFNKIYITQEIKNWGDVVGIVNTAPLEVYKRSDAGGVTESWAKFMKADQDEIKGIGIFGDPGVAEAVKKSPTGIGFNNTLYIYDHTTRKPYEGITPLPIDVNGNGKLDVNENFYSNLDSLTAAINDGRYPSPPARNLYFLSKGKPKNAIVLAFLRWILTDGQKYCKESGYINLPKEVLAVELEKI